MINIYPIKHAQQICKVGAYKARAMQRNCRSIKVTRIKKSRVSKSDRYVTRLTFTEVMNRSKMEEAKKKVSG